MAGTLLSHGGGALAVSPPEDPLQAAAELAAALAALHRQGRVHGRIHPGYVVRAGPTFGLRDAAVPATTLPAGEADLAALAYAAPEVLRGRRPSRAADVHALAHLLGELLSGRTQQPPASVAEAIHRGLHRPPPALVPGLPPRLARLLRRAASRRAWLRPTASDLARALAEARRARAPAAVAGTGAAAPAPPRPEPRPRPSALAAAPLRPARAAVALLVLRARRRAVAAGAGVALLLAGGGIALARRDGALERAVADRLEARDLAGARRLLAGAERERRGDALLDKLRGDVACAARSYAECLRRYEAALAARPALGRDERLRQNALALASRGEERRALVAVLARLPAADDELLAMTRSPRYWPRWNAVRALEARGGRDRIDLARVYALDLLHAGSCDTRRAAAEKLRTLRDPRVLPELTQAREAARSSWSEWRCTGPEVEAALRATRLARVAAR